jgi:hypothetical protein
VKVKNGGVIHVTSSVAISSTKLVDGTRRR